MRNENDRIIRLIPDFEGELCLALCRVEELLFMLAEWELDCPGALDLPYPLSDRRALTALNRLQDILAPTQSAHGRPATCGGRLFDIDGVRETPALRLLIVDPDDLRLLNDTAILLGHTVALDPECELSEAMHICADATGTDGWTPAPIELIEEFTRALGVLDLADTDDTSLLIAMVATVGDGDAYLDQHTAPAYQRTMARHRTMWAGGLDRYAE
jgi:hypothetical protein